MSDKPPLNSSTLYPALEKALGLENYRVQKLTMILRPFETVAVLVEFEPECDQEASLREAIAQIERDRYPVDLQVVPAPAGEFRHSE